MVLLVFRRRRLASNSHFSFRGNGVEVVFYFLTPQFSLPILELGRWTRDLTFKLLCKITVHSSHFTIQALYFEQTINQDNAMKRCSGDKVDSGIVFVCTANKATHANQAHYTLRRCHTNRQTSLAAKQPEGVTLLG